MQSLAVQSQLCRDWRYSVRYAEFDGTEFGGTESATQSWRCRVSYAEFDGTEFGGTESAMQSWRYRVSYAELVVKARTLGLRIWGLGTHLPPAQFQEAMAKPNSIMIDARNLNEALIGKFSPPPPEEGDKKVRAFWFKDAKRFS
eukprot:gene32466-31079_t